jgi:hypothetical protein
MRSRTQITKTEKLASALLEVQRLRGNPIPREHARQMHAEQICSLFQFDHAAGYATHGADNHPTGLTPMLIADHREKTAKFDVPAIAKTKRINRSHTEFRARMLAKSGQDADACADAPKAARKAKIQSRGFQKGQRPLTSRNTFAKILTEKTS